MKIAVVGCGAVGSFYGAMLARAGEQVHFLLRSDYKVVRRNGVRIRSPQGDFTVQPKCASSPKEIGESDLVLIGLKTTANGFFSQLLPPLVNQRTAVLTLQNGLGNEEQLAQIFPGEQILGGLCFVCLNRLEPGLILHLDHGQIVLGEFQRWPEPRTHDIASLFRHAGVPCAVTDDLRRTHWEKLVWNIPFNGLGVASVAGYEALISGLGFDSPVPASARVPPGSHALPAPPGRPLTTDKLLADAKWATLVRELMLEIVATARALGLELPESLADKQIGRTRTMGPYKASTLLDFERGQPLELASLFLAPLDEARRLRVPVPRLEALCSVLQRLAPNGSS